MHAPRLSKPHLYVGFALAACAAVALHAQQAKTVNDAALKNAGKTGDEWLTYGLTPGETRYSPLKQIDAANVSRLGLAWSYDIGPGGGNQEATPLVLERHPLQHHQLEHRVRRRRAHRQGEVALGSGSQPDRRAPEVCCGIVNRGIALYQGKIIAPIIDGRLIALDAETGKPVGNRASPITQDNYTLTMAPRIAKGKVIIGVAGAEYPVRGFFAAYDAKTGKFAWKFYTVPGDPSKPFENEAMKKAAATWSGEWWKLGGGGTVWDGLPTIPKPTLFYVGTGNARSWPEELRNQGQGQSLCRVHPRGEARYRRV